jgi:hypothetical protein
MEKYIGPGFMGHDLCVRNVHIIIGTYIEILL